MLEKLSYIYHNTIYLPLQKLNLTKEVHRAGEKIDVIHDGQNLTDEALLQFLHESMGS